MARITMQFHATEDELVAMFEAWSAASTVRLTAVRAFPFRASPVALTELRASIGDPSVRRLLVTHCPASVHPSNDMELLDSNDGALTLNIGRVGPRGLEECHLAAPVACPEWTALATVVKRHTVAGVIGVHEKTGATAEYRAHRLSPGAVALSASGVALRPFSSSPVVYRPLRV